MYIQTNCITIDFNVFFSNIDLGYPENSLNGIAISDVSLISTPTAAPSPVPSTSPTPNPTPVYKVQVAFVIAPICVLLVLLLGVLVYFKIIDPQRFFGKRFRKKVYVSNDDDEDDEGIFYFVSEENITLDNNNLVNLILSEL